MKNNHVKITGAYHSKFGKLEDETLYSLYEQAAKGAIEDADIEAKHIDGVFVGNYSGGSFNNQENIAPYGINALPELRNKPFYRVETACTSGSSAIHMAMMAIKSGMMKKVLVVGLEKMTAVSTKDVTVGLAKATYWQEEGNKGVNAPCMFADLAKGYMKKYNVEEQQLQKWLAAIASKNYHNAMENSLAHIRKARTVEEILALPDDKNPMVEHPLRLHDCSLISDGAAALIIEAADAKSDGVMITSFYNASDYLDSFGKKKSDYFLEGVQFAVSKVLKEANLSIKDIDLAEVHDCFTITELLIYSAMGLVKPGEEYKALEKKLVYKNGHLPVNLSGGLKSKGHPIGATGVSMHAYIYKQLMGQAWGNQLDQPKRGLTVNIGGSGTSNCVSVLERVG